MLMVTTVPTLIEAAAISTGILGDVEQDQTPRDHGHGED